MAKKTRVVKRQLVYADDGVTVAENGFLMIGNVPLGFLRNDGTLELHVRGNRRCADCEVPTVALRRLVELAGEYGV